MHSIKRVVTLLIFIIIVAVIQALGTFATDLTIDTWYQTLRLPAWRPPGFVFGPVWIILYLLIAFSGFLFWMQPNSKKRILALLFCLIQLILNGIWSFLFFGLQSPLIAGIDVLLILLFLILTMIYGFKVHKWASYLLIPYLIWVIFAGILNWEIIFLNY